MIVTERDYMAQKEYYKDQMRAANRYHLARESLARQARAGHNTGTRFYAQALAWLRRRVAAWTSTRQERYDTVAPPAVPQPQ